mmetsp:Transcript_21954/g.52256  ORF Transcript_21954/g.52256 Transcript_21954/m.52256 type:complete len:409 (+) Transcript_21954:35-1261(+)
MEKESPSSAPTKSPTQCSKVDSPFPLSRSQIERYLKDGVLVVDDILSESELKEAKNGLMQSLRRRGVKSFSVDDIESAFAFQKLSSTNGSGGVLDIFHDDWKLTLIATHPKLFSITKQLWKAAYNCGKESKEALPECQKFSWHPYGEVDFDNKGYCYIDRVGYRLPTELAQEWGDLIHKHDPKTNLTKATSKKKKKLRSIQRSLTPHLDCCPDNMYENVSKWRPVQCFVSLTENLEANTGGFEAVLGGFHRTFDEWAQRRNIESRTDNDVVNSSQQAPCLGQYTHVRPHEDIEVMKRICHIPVNAGSAVFWDNRIPHANSYRNDSKSVARAVVYASFLPDVELNRSYIKNQLKAWRQRHPIRDQWNRISENNEMETKILRKCEMKEISLNNEEIFSHIGKQLMGIKPW